MIFFEVLSDALHDFVLLQENFNTHLSFEIISSHMQMQIQIFFFPVRKHECICFRK